MDEHLSSNMLYLSLQCAKCRFHSTETAHATLFITIILLQLPWTCPDAIQSLGCIRHSSPHLLQHLEHWFSITSIAIKWSMSTSMHRHSASACAWHPLSDSANLSYGVPPGSVLGLFHFTLYTRGTQPLWVKEQIEHSKIT